MAVVGDGAGDWEWVGVGVANKNAPGGRGPVEVRRGGICGRAGDPFTLAPLGLVEGGGREALRVDGLGEGLRLRIGGLLLPTLPACENDREAGMGAMMDMSELSLEAARALAASASTLGTDCSICSVALERGVRCGWCEEGCGDGIVLGRTSMSRSKIADDEERLE